MDKKNKINDSSKKIYYEEFLEPGKIQGGINWKEQIKRGFGVFLIIAASIVFYFLFLKFSYLFEGIGVVINILKPIVYGLTIAYLLNPIVGKVERLVLKVASTKFKIQKDLFKTARAIGVFVAIIFLNFVIFLLISMILPQLWISIQNLIKTLPNQIDEFAYTISNIEITNETVAVVFDEIINKISTSVQSWLQNDLLSQANNLMTNVLAGAINVVSEVFNILMGMIVSIYVLFSKEVFTSQCKKITYAILPTRNANIVLHIVNKSNEIFGGFVIGKIIDSAIIGVICFVVLTIINMPYALLVSVIVGATNVIPFFGPFIGAVPCTILILLQDPIMAVYFVIFIVILQQIDGNIIGPKILGDSTGLSSFWVITAILLGGGLFGFVGMVVGVPTFAVLYYIVRLYINQKLISKKLPTSSEQYDKHSYVDNYTNEFVSSEEKENNK